MFKNASCNPVKETLKKSDAVKTFNIHYAELNVSLHNSTQ